MGSLHNVSQIYFIKTDSLGNSNCNESTVPTIVTPLSIQDMVVPPLDSTVLVSALTEAFSQASGASSSNLCIDNGTSFTDFNQDELLIFPNPATSQFTISTSQNASLNRIQIFNILGEKIYSAEVRDQHITINSENFSEGTYFVKLENDEQEFATAKLIILR